MAVYFVVHLPYEESDMNNSAGLPFVTIDSVDECDNKQSSTSINKQLGDNCFVSQPLLRKPESMKDLSKPSPELKGLGSRQTSESNLPNIEQQTLEIKKGDKVRFKVIPTANDEAVLRSSSSQLQKSQPHIDAVTDEERTADLEDVVVERLTLKEASAFITNL
jgi:hypothetical protein